VKTLFGRERTPVGPVSGVRLGIRRKPLRGRSSAAVGFSAHGQIIASLPSNVIRQETKEITSLFVRLLLVM
jgi:hypothetical protein